MEKKKKSALFTVVLQLSTWGPQSAFPRSTLLSKRAARGLPSFSFLFFCSALEIPLRQGVVTRFLFLLGRRPLSPAFPATRSRLFALSFPRRSLGSWPQSISFAASRKANFPRPLLPPNTLLNRVRARTVSCARVAMISNLATVPFRVDFFFLPFSQGWVSGRARVLDSSPAEFSPVHTLPFFFFFWDKLYQTFATTCLAIERH